MAKTSILNLNFVIPFASSGTPQVLRVMVSCGEFMCKPRDAVWHNFPLACVDNQPTVTTSDHEIQTFREGESGFRQSEYFKLRV